MTYKCTLITGRLCFSNLMNGVESSNGVERSIRMTHTVPLEYNFNVPAQDIDIDRRAPIYQGTGVGD